MKYGEIMNREIQETKTEHGQESGVLQMVKVMGNQAVMQRMFEEETLPGRPRPRYIEMDGSSDNRQGDPTYSSTEQYLDPAALRRNLGGQSGGEAHHIIPSCLADKCKLSPSTCNEAWNGILLPGSPSKCPLDSPEVKPYHRKEKARDHPEYTAVVAAALRGKIGQAKIVAAKMQSKIMALRAGSYIDEIT